MPAKKDLRHADTKCIFYVYRLKHAGNATMQATIVDLRYKMKEVLKALERKEPVRIVYHGKEKGIIIPSRHKTYKKASEHPFFGTAKISAGSPPVEMVINGLRGGRFSDI